MLSCHEARTLLYDIQTMRTPPKAERDERGSMLALAKAHLLTCVMCNGFFEQERAFVRALHDRVLHVHQPMPVAMLSNTLQLIQRARVEELHPRLIGSVRRKFSSFIRSLFRQ